MTRRGGQAGLHFDFPSPFQRTMAFLRAAPRAAPLPLASFTAPVLAALHTSPPHLRPAKTQPSHNVPPASVGGERIPVSQEDDPKQGGKGFLGVSCFSSSYSIPLQKKQR